MLIAQRIVIPSVLRGTILSALHAAHQGVSAMNARARDSIYWPDITVDISKMRDRCTHCPRTAKSNAMQPPADIRSPDYPFQKICSDYFTYGGKDYVVIVDRYSNWPMIFRSEYGVDGLIRRLRKVFIATFGIAEELTSDGDPHFTFDKTQELRIVKHKRKNCKAQNLVCG